MPHTPGPWEFGHPKPIPGVTTIRGWFISPTNGKRPVLDIAEVHLTASQDAATQEANARLIAAAPDLLAALKSVVFILGTRPKHSAFFNLVDECKAAIAKAEGK